MRCLQFVFINMAVSDLLGKVGQGSPVEYVKLDDSQYPKAEHQQVELRRSMLISAAVVAFPFHPVSGEMQNSTR